MSSRRAFTLIELLVVIAIIAILVALLLPAVQQVREAARKSQCQDHLHNLAVALHDYEVNFKRMPTGIMRSPSNGNDSVAVAWSGMLLPYIEQKPLYDTINWNGFGPEFRLGPLGVNAWDDNGPLEAALSTKIDVYVCPSSGDPEYVADGTGTMGGIANLATTNYLGVQSGSVGNPVFTTANGYPRTANGENHFHLDDSMGLNDFAGNGGGHDRVHGCFVPVHSVTFAMVTDGTSNTAVFGETLTRWINPSNKQVRVIFHNAIGCNSSNDDGYRFLASLGPPINWATGVDGAGAVLDDNDLRAAFASRHPGGAQFSMLDAKVTFISENVDNRIRLGIASRDGGESVTVP